MPIISIGFSIYFYDMGYKFRVKGVPMYLVRLFLPLATCFLISLPSSFAFSESEGMSWPQTTQYILSGIVTTFAIPGGFGVGHYIVGERKMGTIFLVSQLAVAGITTMVWASCPSEGFFSHNCNGLSKDVISFMKYPFLGIWAWQIFDIWANGKSYLKKGDQGISVSLDPISANLLVRYSF
jgi:hypothetical protein